MRERAKRQGRAYSAIPNAALRDSSISMEARGLLALLMTFSDTWVFQKSHLMDVTGWGRDKFEKHMGELRRAQYVDLVQERDATGRVQGSTWIIRDEGNRSPENQGVGDDATEALKNQHTAKPSAGKSAPIRRTILKEEQKEETQTLFSEILPEQKPEPENDRFPEFWEAYPTCQRKTDKPKAKVLFAQIVAGKHKAVEKTDAETIIAAVKRYAASNPDPQYIPLPTTWLNGARWASFAQPVEDEETRAYRARMATIRDAALAAQGARQ